MNSDVICIISDYIWIYRQTYIVLYYKYCNVVIIKTESICIPIS